jgi:hypothetical protein
MTQDRSSTFGDRAGPTTPTTPERGGPPPRPDKTVYLHVGAPKTGTTALQSLLWHNRYHLADLGVCYPLGRPLEHIDAGMDIRDDVVIPDAAWATVTGAWRQVAERIQDWPGPAVVLSSEVLGGAPPHRIQHVVESLQPATVHVIMTVRDLARQVPSDWQEHLKHRKTMPLSQFVQDLADSSVDTGPQYARMFWRQQDPIQVLDAWAAHVRPTRIHVVTVPLERNDRTILFERFLSVLGIGTSELCLDGDLNANPSIGVNEAEFLRRANPLLVQRLGPAYAPLVRELVGEDILVKRRHSDCVQLPRSFQPWIVERSVGIAMQLGASPYHIVGDLDELIPSRCEGPGQVAPQTLPPAAMTPVAYDVVADLLVEITELQQWIVALREQVRGLGGQPRKRPGSRTAPREHESHGNGPGYLRVSGSRVAPSRRIHQRPPLTRSTHDLDHASSDVGTPAR